MSTGDFILDELLKQHAEQKESIQRVRELLPKWQVEAKEFQCACYGGVVEDLSKALDGDVNERI